MSNLLDKASIILTPTAYNNGEALCVKPSDGSGDFDFSRNSAATRVNAQGLVENVQILSSNLVQNGDFSEEGVQEVSNGSFSQEGVEEITGGDFSNPSDWGLAGGSPPTITNNKLNLIGDTYNSIASNVGASIVSGKTYKVSFEITDYTSGGATFRLGGVFGVSKSGLGVHTQYIVSDGTAIRLYSSENGTDLSLTNVSVREVAQNWDLGTGWSIGEDKAVHTGAQSLIGQTNILTIGKSYKITFDLSGADNSNYARLLSSQYPNGGNYTSDGTITVYTTTNIDDLYIYGVGNISITNISVKEVGQNWTLNDWSVGDSLISSGNTSSLLQQPTIYTNATGIYKTTFKAKSVNGTSVTLRLYDGSTNFETFTITSSDFQDFELIRQRAGTDTTLSIYNNSNAEIEITNISVIEITDDTNLPRISYENFSYQDALGSELVTNGDFATDDNWIKGAGWSISGGSANGSNTISDLYQENVVESGKYYKVTYTISNYVSGSVRVELPNNAFSGTERSANGTYTEILLSGGTLVLFDARASFTGSIDNVSVKEYLGQEVVPNSGCGSWLFEPQTTQLVTYSEDFSQWTGLINLSIGLNEGVSPSGEVNANLLSLGVDASVTRHRLYLLYNFVLGNEYTFSVFAKKDEQDWFQLMYGGAFDTQSYANFDLANGVVGNVGTSTDANIVDYGNGWYRCSITCTATATISSTYEILTTNNTNSGRYPSYQSTTNTNVCFLWGAQLEQQSYATSYIPTSGSQVTRNQDVCTNGATGTGLINSAEGTLYAEIAAFDTTDNSFRFISLSDGSLNNVVKFVFYLSDIYAETVVNGVNQGQTSYTFPNISAFNKIAFVYSVNNFALWVNGIEVSIDTNGAVFPTNTLTDLSFDRGDGGSKFFGKTKALAVWKEALSDSELQSLTTI